MSQTTLHVEGMSCGSCVNKIEGNVGQLEGVESVNVQLSEGKVDVAFSENTVKLNEIKNVIQDAGYEVKEDSAEGGDSECSCCH